MLIDRNVDQALAKAGEDYLAFVGSNFVEEGQRVADWTIKQTGGKGKIIELEGTVGGSPANDRKKGFDETIKAKDPDMEIVASSPATSPATRAARSPRRCCRRIPTTTIVYAHNDEMAIGAIAAMEAAGKKPATTSWSSRSTARRTRVQAIIDGKLGATCECSPRFGPKAFEIMSDYADGKTIPPVIINPDRFFDSSNAKEMLATAF